MRFSILAIGVMLLGSRCGSDAAKNAATPVDHPPRSLASMDDLLAQLASRAQDRIGSSPDFKIIVTSAAYPIGTLMHVGTTIPVDYSACQAASQPPSAPTPNLFPNYTITQGVAVGFGVDPALLHGLASAGAGIDATKSVNVAFSNSHLLTLSDSDMKQIKSLPGCASQLAAGPMLLVRGYIVGRRTFTVATKTDVDANLRLPATGSFVVAARDSRAVDIADNGDVGYLQIVSELKPAATASGITVSAPTAGTASQALSGRVYVQRDASDSSGRDAAIVAALGAASFSVVPQVQSIASTKVPNNAQVRYFNVEDAPRAKLALAELQKIYPAAQLVKVGLPSPSGQLEIWLPRANAVAASQINPAAIRNLTSMVPPRKAVPANAVSTVVHLPLSQK